VILQDEQLVIREIERNMQRAMAMAAAAPAAALAAGVGAGIPMSVPAGLGGAIRPLPYVPAEAQMMSDFDSANDEGGVDDGPAEAGGGSLAAVAKAASMKAERAAIEHTLRQVHWNRRKAAQTLGVSYKTLLNKIKECGISRV